MATQLKAFKGKGKVQAGAKGKLEEKREVFDISQFFTIEEQNLLRQKNLSDINPDNLAEILQLIETMKEGALTDEYLNETGSGLVFGSPLMSEAKVRYDRAKEAYKNKQMEVEEGIYQCRRCKGKQTISVAKVCRSGDEAIPNAVTCVSCGYKWTEYA